MTKNKPSKEKREAKKEVRKAARKAKAALKKHGSKPNQEPTMVVVQENAKDAGVLKKKKKSKKRRETSFSEQRARKQKNKEFDDQVLQLEERNMGKGNKPKATKVVAITLQPSLLQETMRQIHQQPTMHYADTLLVGETVVSSSHATNLSTFLSRKKQQRLDKKAMAQNQEQHVNKYAALDDDDDSDEERDQSYRKYQLQLQPSLLGNLSSLPAVMGTNEIDDDDL